MPFYKITGQWINWHFISVAGVKRKDGVKKRKLGRNPRVPFTQHQVSTLERKFQRTHYLSSVDVAELSAALNLTETRVSFVIRSKTQLLVNYN